MVGKDLAAVLQALELSEATFHRWRNQYGGMKSEEAKRLKQLEEENKRLKEIVAEKELDFRMLNHPTATAAYLTMSAESSPNDDYWRTKPRTEAAKSGGLTIETLSSPLG